MDKDTKDIFDKYADRTVSKARRRGIKDLTYNNRDQFNMYYLTTQDSLKPGRRIATNSLYNFMDSAGRSLFMNINEYVERMTKDGIPPAEYVDAEPWNGMSRVNIDPQDIYTSGIYKMSEEEMRRKMIFSLMPTVNVAPGITFISPKTKYVNEPSWLGLSLLRALKRTKEFDNTSDGSGQYLLVPMLAIHDNNLNEDMFQRTINELAMFCTRNGILSEQELSAMRDRDLPFTSSIQHILHHGDTEKLFRTV
jgi:hypothetical protein